MFVRDDDVPEEEGEEEDDDVPVEVGEERDNERSVYSAVQCRDTCQGPAKHGNCLTVHSCPAC